jgi:hypothetical protein
MREVFWSVKVSEALDVPVVETLDPFGRLVEAGPNGDFEVWELGVFNMPFRGLVIGFLILGNLSTQDTDFFFEVIFKSLVVSFMASDGFKEAFTDLAKSDCINVLSGGEGGFNSVGGHRLLRV